LILYSRNRSLFVILIRSYIFLLFIVYIGRYAKDRCLFHSVKEEEFITTWNTLNNMVGLMKTDYSVEDLSYEELTVSKETILNSSH
jgi:hypothetical protein